MPVTVNSPYSGRPVKVRDQDVGRAVRDEDGRIFYVVPRSSGEGFYAAPTRKGSEKDEQRYDEMIEKMEQSDEQVKGNLPSPRDATGRKRRRPVLWLLIVLLIGLGAAAVYFVLIEGEGPAAKWFDSLLESESNTTQNDADSRSSEGARNIEDARNPTGTTSDPSDRGAGSEASPEPASNASPTAEEAAILEAISVDLPAGPDDRGEFTRLASGLMYRTDRRGVGEPATAGQYVELRYRDKRFHEPGRIDAQPWQPTSFVLWTGDAPRGWDQAIAGMRPGERRTALLPQPTPEGGRRYDVAQFELLDARPGVQARTELTGEGPIARPGDRVTVHYQGFVVTSPDSADTVAEPFTSTRDMGGPMSFTLGGGDMIEGLELGVAGMRVGEVRSLTIPPHLAYGSKSIGEVVPAHATLLFIVELLEVE